MTPSAQSAVETLKEAVLHLSEEQARDLGVACAAHADRLKTETQARAREDAQAEIEKARERARAILAAAGLPFEEPKTGKAKPRKAAPKVSIFKAGHRYQHPDDPSKVWSGTGVQPAWVKDLVAAGRLPTDATVATREKMGAGA